MSLTRSLLIVLLLVGSFIDVQAGSIWRSRDAEPDEASCICGITMEILNKLESIIQSSKSSSCSISAHVADSDDPANETSVETTPSTTASSQVSDPSDAIAKLTLQIQQLETLILNSRGQQNSQSSGQSQDPSTAQITTPTSQSTTQPGGQATSMIAGHPTPTQSTIPPPIQLPSVQSTSTSTSSSIINRPNVVQTTAANTEDKPRETNGGNQKQDDVHTTIGINNGFLNGLSSSDANEMLSKLNQSQAVNPTEMANVLESTVPNVVSNIFSNIQNVTEEVSKRPQQANSGSDVLVSIDGSSVNVHGDSSDMIISEGERLFLLWIERQLESLHLTASMANYIRKNAVTLFRRIVKQYVARIEKLGGSLEDNVRRATQAALNNTQNLTLYLLKNYLYFAAGIMQIIGEQVSRIGKQIDYTGASISKISLNPFDVVSNVLRSLPDPSRYSEYFRAFGKQIMGETSPAPMNNIQETESTEEPPSNKRLSLLKKTMGALSKTLNSWVG